MRAQSPRSGALDRTPTTVRCARYALGRRARFGTRGPPPAAPPVGSTIRDDEHRARCRARGRQCAPHRSRLVATMTRSHTARREPLTSVVPSAPHPCGLTRGSRSPREARLGRAVLATEPVETSLRAPPRDRVVGWQSLSRALTTVESIFEPSESVAGPIDSIPTWVDNVRDSDVESVLACDGARKTQGKSLNRTRCIDAFCAGAMEMAAARSSCCISRDTAMSVMRCACFSNFRRELARTSHDARATRGYGGADAGAMDQDRARLLPQTALGAVSRKGAGAGAAAGHSPTTATRDTRPDPPALRRRVATYDRACHRRRMRRTDRERCRATFVHVRRAGADADDDGTLNAPVCLHLQLVVRVQRALVTARQPSRSS